MPALQDQIAERSSPQTVPTTSVSPDASPAFVAERQLQQRRPEALNSDGSVSLGLRPREPAPTRPHEILPTDFTGFGRPQSMSPDAAYQQERMRNLRFSSPFNPPLTIPPIQTIPSSQSSSQLDHSRKRSFAAAESSGGPEKTPDSARSNRLSSISSILNPARQSMTANEDMSVELNYQRSPHMQAQQQRGLSQTQLPGPSSLLTSEHRPNPMDYQDPSNAVAGLEKSSRKAQLKQEAEAMRAMLKAKEQELQELDGEG